MSVHSIESAPATAPTMAAAPPSPSAFEFMIHAHLPAARALARRMLPSRDLAEDAVQEALFTLWRLQVAPPHPRAWLLRAVRLRSLHLARSLRRRCRHEAGACTCGTVPGDPRELVVARDLAKAISRAVDDLGDEQRLVLLLRERDGLDYPEIATRLGVPIGTVRSRLHRARGNLRTRLAGDDAA